MTAFFFVLCSFVLNGQNNAIDSLKTVLRIQTEDTNKVVKLNSLSRDFLNKGNLDLASQYAIDALALSRKLNYKSGQANSFELIGYVLADRNNVAEARKNFFSALTINELLNNQRKTAINYTVIGQSYGLEEIYPEALKYLYQALKRWERLVDKKNTALCLTDIAFCYHNQDNDDECLKHVSKALNLYENIGDKNGIARTSNFMAMIYMNLGNYIEALKKDSAVLKIYNDLGNNIETFYVFQNMGNIDEKKGDQAVSNGEKGVASTLYKQAFGNYNKALFSSLQGTDSSMIAEAYANLGNIHIKLENFNDARRGLVKSLQMSKSNKGDLKTVYSSLATLDSIQGNYKEAYKHYRLFIQYRDSLTNEENSRKSTQTRLQYEFDKKEAVAKEEQEKKDTEAKRVKNLQYFAIGGL
ncbi:MAG TPA: tetratricopeptide repeat protein, partial [Chitinophagaceae bacterium]|nr:tetratricopeptide repeat protein [Chitinophagaceae bacterium]